MIPIKDLFNLLESHLSLLLSTMPSEEHIWWPKLLHMHPADIAAFIERLPKQDAITLFGKLPLETSSQVFERLSDATQAQVLEGLETDQATRILHNMPVDKITDLFGLLSDENLNKYLRLLQKKDRHRVISLLHFDPESAGGIMNSEVLTLPHHVDIKQAINILQRLQPKREHHQRIYVTDKNNILIGYINVEDLLLNKPETPLSRIMRKNELIVDVHEDQEYVARQMQHYDLLSAPVVDREHHFLGIITADDVFDIIQREVSEDVYKSSGQAPIVSTYFKTPFIQLLWQRIPWLIGLLLLQSISSIIMGSYQATLEANAVLAIFITMLIGTGGNAGNQSGALVLRGLTTGEINRPNGMNVLFRELRLSMVIAFILTSVAFFRVYFDPRTESFSQVVAICGSLYLIVVTSIFMGTFLPLLFERLNIDPANTAAPFLATLMDIIGVLIYCTLSAYILST